MAMDRNLDHDLDLTLKN